MCITQCGGGDTKTLSFSFVHPFLTPRNLSPKLRRTHCSGFSGDSTFALSPTSIMFSIVGLKKKTKRVKKRKYHPNFGTPNVAIPNLNYPALCWWSEFFMECHAIHVALFLYCQRCTCIYLSL